MTAKYISFNKVVSFNGTRIGEWGILIPVGGKRRREDWVKYSVHQREYL